MEIYSRRRYEANVRGGEIAVRPSSAWLMATSGGEVSEGASQRASVRKSLFRGIFGAIQSAKEDAKKRKTEKKGANDEAHTRENSAKMMIKIVI